VLREAKDMMNNPCFVIAHELFDALPIHQFHLNHNKQWCEKVVQLNPDSNELEFAITQGPTENTIAKLQPEKLFS
jgi:SAM-dependent MidA family methyltransferase